MKENQRLYGNLLMATSILMIWLLIYKVFNHSVIHLIFFCLECYFASKIDLHDEDELE